MKKIALLLLAAVLVLTAFVGCGSKADTWDGTTATAFAGGDGSKQSPYIIETVEQLAYLAESVNGGTSYAGKHFRLARDLDLSDKPWMPIGNTTDSRFAGHFDGDGHTVSGLSIQPHIFEYPNMNNVTVRGCVGGLFGYVDNAVLEDFCLDSPVMTLLDAEESVLLFLGMVAGYADADTEMHLRDIHVTGAEVVLDYGETMSKSGMPTVIVGGIVGAVFSDDGAPVSMERITAEMSLTIGEENSYTYETNLGGIAGVFSAGADTTIVDAVCELNLHYARSTDMHLRCAAIGSASLGADSTFTVRRVFSRILTDAETNMLLRTDRSVTAIFAEVRCHDTEGCVLEDAYGYATWKNVETGERETSMRLYEATGSSTPTEKNSAACESLPEGHGLTTDVWDATDPTKPVLKH